jgi:hypothetical protein
MLFAATLGLPACGDDEPAGPNGGGQAWEGTWNATSFMALGTDAIEDGMTLQGTFTASTYTLTVSNDQVGVCGDGGTPNCTTTGTLAGTSSQITIDAGDEDAVTFNYSISGNTMMWSGSIDGNAVSVTWARAN